jgi:hypothetical protein
MFFIEILCTNRDTKTQLSQMDQGKIRFLFFMVIHLYVNPATFVLLIAKKKKSSKIKHKKKS